jgi:hypothetical protein
MTTTMNRCTNPKRFNNVHILVPQRLATWIENTSRL